MLHKHGISDAFRKSKHRCNLAPWEQCPLGFLLEEHIHKVHGSPLLLPSKANPDLCIGNKKMAQHILIKVEKDMNNNKRKNQKTFVVIEQKHMKDQDGNTAYYIRQFSTIMGT